MRGSFVIGGDIFVANTSNTAQKYLESGHLGVLRVEIWLGISS